VDQPTASAALWEERRRSWLLHAGGIDFGWASAGSAINWPAESGGRE